MLKMVCITYLSDNLNLMNVEFKVSILQSRVDQISYPCARLNDDLVDLFQQQYSLVYMLLVYTTDRKDAKRPYVFIWSSS